MGRAFLFSLSHHPFSEAISSVRRQIKIRPGFTPQEDVNRFRGTKQMQMDANALPKGHIIGWVPPPTGKSGTAANAIASDTTPISKAAKKNAKRKEKREKEKLVVPDNWEDEEGDEKSAPADNASQPASSTKSEEDRLSGKLEKLQLK